MLLEEIARTSATIAETPARLVKIGALAETLRHMSPEEAAVGVAYLSGELPQGSIGVGWASLRDLPSAAPSPSLELLKVDRAMARIASTTGPGSQAARRDELASLFASATVEERRFLIGLLLGELRQGALAGVMTEAVA
ncbi:MAG TPA: ATP-dependent DNA ligase, partial [Actinomycetota bacterium]|nr:ATP-dependent DNA ligase [Actinomycetota bacterium]